MGIPISASVIVLGAEAWPPRSGWNCIANYPVSSPGPYPIRPQGTYLARHLRAIVDAADSTGPPEAKSLKIQVSRCATLGNLSGCETPQDVRLERGASRQFFDATVQSMQVVPGLWAIESGARRDNHRRGKYVQAVAFRLSVTRTASKDRPTLIQLKLPSRRCSPKFRS